MSSRSATIMRATAAELRCAGLSTSSISARRSTFLGGASYSIADIATFACARNVGTFLGKAAEADYAKLMVWVATIAGRPAVQRALAAVDEVRAKTTQFDKASAEAMD